MKRYDLSQTLFLDIDSDISEAKHHLSQHNAFLRPSVSGINYHAIVFDPCDTCDKYTDKRYFGETLFNNKGTKWASPLWINYKTHECVQFNPIYIVHFFYPKKKKNIHIYCSLKLLSHKWIDIPVTDHWYFTFHQVICKERNYFNRFNMSQSEDDVFDFEQYIQLYNFQQWQSKEQMKSWFVTFLHSIPIEFQYL